MIQRTFYLMMLFPIMASAQLTPIGGSAQPMAGPVNPPGDLNTIVFDYDTAGNQTKRTFVYLAAKPAFDDSIYDKDISAVEKEGQFQTIEEYPEISYYPNPVKTQLYLKWMEKDGKDLQTLELYNMSGVLLSHYTQQSNNSTLEIDFSGYPSGMYNLLLLYNSGERKDLKIVKQ